MLVIHVLALQELPAMPMMTSKAIHAALKSAGVIGPKGQETAQLKHVLETQRSRLGQIQNIYASRKGSKARPYPHLILLTEEVTGAVHEYFSIVISPDYRILEAKHPHKKRKGGDASTRFFGGSRKNLTGINDPD